ncbi:hypothetical protein CVT24_003185, partial [Panaeolus cyanescens]
GVDTALLRESLEARIRATGAEPPEGKLVTNIGVLGRDSVPEDIAGVVSFLVSENASMITGQSISVNGGAYFD